MPVSIGSKRAAPAAPEAPPQEEIALVTLAAPKVKCFGERTATTSGGFDVLVRYGVRWEPGEKSPRVCLGAYRRLTLGDTMGWRGQKVVDMCGLPDLQPFADADGKPVGEIDSSWLAAFGLAIPLAPEEPGDLLLPWQR